MEDKVIEVEVEKTTKQKIKDIWADKKKRYMIIGAIGAGTIIIFGSYMYFKGYNKCRKVMSRKMADILEREHVINTFKHCEEIKKASADGIHRGMNFASLLADRGYNGSSYHDIFDSKTGEVMGIIATVSDGKKFRLYDYGEINGKTGRNMYRCKEILDKTLQK